MSFGLASRCAVCRSWPTRPICANCVSRFMPPVARCKRCALALPGAVRPNATAPPLVCGVCLRSAPPLDATLACVDYAFPWSGMVGRFKYGAEPAWAGFFGELMLESEALRAVLAALEVTDFVVPMPLAAQRLQQRGFNQAWELTRAIVKGSGTRARADARLLLRSRNTPPQAELGRAARLANVEGAFQIDPLRTPLLAGRRVLLVDDVMTSGASLFTAARELQRAGAAHVTATVFARTGTS